MKLIRAIVAALCVALMGIAPARAQQTQAQLDAWIQQYITTNGQQAITGAILGTFLTNLTNSVCLLTDVTTCYAAASGLPFSVASALTNDANCTNASVTGETNQYTQIVNAIASTPAGGVLYLPQGITFCTYPTVAITKQITIEGGNSIWRNGAANGTAVAPVVDFQNGATGAGIRNITIDQRSNTGNFTDSHYFPCPSLCPSGYNAWGGIAVAFQGNYQFAQNLTVQNGFDNCIGVSQINPSTGFSTFNQPQGFQGNTIWTSSCGVGYHASNQGGPGYIGSGFDNGSGGATQLVNFYNTGSYNGIINDIGSGAHGNYVNITIDGTMSDPVNNNGSGTSVYNGAPANWANVKVYNNHSRYVNGYYAAIWDDHGASNDFEHSTWANVSIKDPDGACILEKGASKWSGVDCGSPNYLGSLNAVGLAIDSNAGVMTGLQIDGFSVSGTTAVTSIYGQTAVTVAATATWTTSSPTISVTSCSAFTAGKSVYDLTVSSTLVGVVSGCTGTTLTLAANAAIASSGSADSLQVGFAVTGAINATTLTGTTNYISLAANFGGLTVTSQTSKGRTITNGGLTATPVASFPLDIYSLVRTQGYITSGSTPTNTGTCSITNQKGSTAGVFQLAGSCSAQTVIFNLPTAVQGWACSAQPLTGSDTIKQTQYQTNSVTFTLTGSTNDYFTYNCFGF